MQTFIATFFSHFGAIRFNKDLKARVSSSCGTCVRFECGEGTEIHSDDLEQLFRLDGEELTMITSNI